MRTVDLIAKKRDGGEHTGEELSFLVQGYTRGDIPDYQMSAWLMAVLWRGLTDAEVFALTGEMAASGETLSLSSISGTPVDKHSTGGVGDKTTLAVVPILASAGVPVVKMSGRGLGHTGGTLDKLEALPGVQVQFATEQILAQMRAVGACICAQTEALVPADRKMYALRDATATVEALPLIAASVMSKKLAAGAPAIMLDVKVGQGAFMKTLPQARALADLMLRIGAAHGRHVAAVLSDMNAPLGRAIGNVLEVQEVCALLEDPENADPRLRHLVRHLSAVGLVLGGKAAALDEGLALTDRQLQTGAARAKWDEIVQAQGGRPDIPLATAPLRQVVQAKQGGFITALDAKSIGLAAMRLGAGRATKEDQIDPAAGIILEKSVGDVVVAGDMLAVLHTARPEMASEAAASVANAFAIASAAPKTLPLIYDTLGL